jgi:hypothetical protein
MSETVLRISDIVIAIWWLWALVYSLRTGFIGLRTTLAPTRTTLPVFFWFMIFVQALMVLHFGGLAYVGQTLPN